MFGILLTLASLWPSIAAAHELRPAIATVQVSERGDLTLALTLNLEAAITGIAAGHEDTSQSPQARKYDRLRSFPAEALHAEFARFIPDFVDRLSLKTDRGPVELAVEKAEIPDVGDIGLPRVSTLLLTGNVTADSTQLFWFADPRLGNSVMRLEDAISGTIVAAEFVLAGNVSEPLTISGGSERNWLATAVGYVEIGIAHIIPKGLDHILFVVGLVLLSTRISTLLWQVSAFTVGHTVTLALSMVGAVQLSPAIVEPLIALSIVYVAIENMLTDRLQRWRPAIVFAFGLLHGLGFAAVLREVGLAPGQFFTSLIAFNLGVEFGQLAVIAGCYLVIGWAMARHWYRRFIAVPGSLAIGAIASFWFAERTGLISAIW